MSNLYAYLNLAIGAQRRLAILKRDAAKRSENFMLNGAPYTWRAMRYAKFDGDGPGLMQTFSAGEQSWYTQGGEQFRREWFCDEIPDGPRIGHTGWFCDSYQDNMARGIVALLPHGRYIAGYYTSGNDERVYFGTLYDTARDAALAADGYADRYAETEREYNARYDAAQKLLDEIDAALGRLRECLALRNDARFIALRDEAHDLIEAIRDKRQVLETEYKGVL